MGSSIVVFLITKGDDIFMGKILGNEVWRCPLGSKDVNSANIDNLSNIILRKYLEIKTNCLNIYNNYSDKEIANLLKVSLKTELLELLEGKKYHDPINILESSQRIQNWLLFFDKICLKHIY